MDATTREAFMNGSKAFPHLLTVPASDKYPSINLYYLGTSEVVGAIFGDGMRQICPTGGNWFLNQKQELHRALEQAAKPSKPVIRKRLK